MAAKRNAEDALAVYENLGCMVGLFAYNPPVCLQAAEDAGRELKIIGFDEDRATVEGVASGAIHGRSSPTS